jgi:protein gp37
MPLRWAKKANGDRPRVFCASLADWLDNRAPREWRSDLGRLIEATPELDWLLLTKRPENYEKLAPWQLDEIPSNVWLGVTCEDQAHYERRWAILSRPRISASLKFVSYEPALGPLTLQRKWSDTVPDWIICGGESGSGARPMKPAWVRTLRTECANLDIAFFMKQIGSNHHRWGISAARATICVSGLKSSECGSFRSERSRRDKIGPQGLSHPLGDLMKSVA